MIPVVVKFAKFRSKRVLSPCGFGISKLAMPVDLVIDTPGRMQVLICSSELPP